jgi:hypothetical protein
VDEEEEIPTSVECLLSITPKRRRRRRRMERRKWIFNVGRVFVLPPPEGEEEE